MLPCLRRLVFYLPWQIEGKKLSLFWNRRWAYRRTEDVLRTNEEYIRRSEEDRFADWDDADFNLYPSVHHTDKHWIIVTLQPKEKKHTTWVDELWFSFHLVCYFVRALILFCFLLHSLQTELIERSWKFEFSNLKERTIELWILTNWILLDREVLFQLKCGVS